MRNVLSYRVDLLKRWGVVVLITVLAVAAYGGTWRNGFVWDDETFIVTNPYVHDLSLWPQYFTKAGTGAGDADSTFVRIYRPVQTLSFAVDAALWKGWGGGFHLTSLFLHIASCLAILFAFGPLVGRRAAVLGAVLFAVHPALSEGALSLAARGNQLYTFFALLSIGWFVRIGRPFDRSHLLSVALALLSFFSKEPAVSLVALLPLLHAAFRRPGSIREPSAIAVHLPYLAAAACFLIARLLVVDTSSPIPYWGSSLGKTVLMQSKVFVTYLRLLVWPWPLLGRYPVPYTDPLVVLNVLINVAAVVLGAVLALRRGRGRMVSLAIAWFYISLAPVSNIIPITGTMMGERFLYFTFAGMLPLLAATLPDPLPERCRRPAIAAGVAVIVLFVTLDVGRTAVWRDNFRFFSVLVREVPDEPIVQTLMAKEEVLAGDPESAVRRMAPLIRFITTYTPREKVASYYWYGRALLDTNRPREAFDQFATITLLLKSVPADIVPFIVEAAARSGKLSFARSLLLKELEGSPNDDMLWNSLGNVLVMMGEGKDAVAAYERALAVNPGNREAAANLLNAQRGGR